MLFYDVTRTGIQWRNLEETNFPDWQAVYYYFRKKKRGTIMKINLALNEFERLEKERNARLSLTFVDSQSIKAAPFVGDREKKNSSLTWDGKPGLIGSKNNFF